MSSTPTISFAILNLILTGSKSIQDHRANVTSSSTVVASLEAARDIKSPLIIQVSQVGATYFAGKGVSNTDQFTSIQCCIAATYYIRSIAPFYGVPVVLHTDHCTKKLLLWLIRRVDVEKKYFADHGEPLFTLYMINLCEEEKDCNIATTWKYLDRAAPMKQWLKMEIGITGGRGRWCR
ncbi:Fructose-bisphosphate aldolase 1 [Rhizina undulata]